MKRANIKPVAVTLLVLSVSAVTAAGVFFIQQQRIDQLETRLAAEKAQSARLASSVTSLETRVSQLETPTTQQKPAPGAGEDDTRSTVTQSDGATTKVRQFAFVTGGSADGDTVTLKLDYADFLTGDAAAAAATEAGSESPPPNDYYISNVNPKLRALKVAPGAKFTVAGMAPEDTSSLDATEFLDAIKGNTDGAADAGYWFTIEDGVIVSAEEQWAP